MFTAAKAQRDPPPDGIGRRRVLAALIIGGSLAAVGGLVARLRTSHYPIDPIAAARLIALRPWQYVLVRDLARRMLASDQPGTAPSPDDVGVAEFVDGYLAKLSGTLRRDFLRMLVFVEQLAPLRVGLLRRFTDLAADEQDQVLAALESSRIGELCAGFSAIKGVVMMGYYRDPATFALIGYKGPLVERTVPEAR
jgi:hypothetical protein